jgi:hypothetical protein
MLIKLIKLPTRTPFWVHSGMVYLIDKHPTDIGTTLVFTTANLGKGPITFEVTDSPEEVAQLVNSGNRADAQLAASRETN